MTLDQIMEIACCSGLFGGRINRFNILKQSKDYDKYGEYIKRWIPELSKVPVSKIHAPWQMSKDEMNRSGYVIGKDYPNHLNQYLNGPMLATRIILITVKARNKTKIVITNLNRRSLVGMVKATWENSPFVLKNDLKKMLRTSYTNNYIIYVYDIVK